MNRWTVVLDNTFTAKLNPDIVLDPTHAYSIALLRGQLLYSWYNISAALGNNTFSYSDDNGVTWNPVVVPDGTWSSCMLIDFIKNIFGDDGGTPPIDNIEINELSYNGSWEITTVNNHLFDTGTVGSIIGFANNFIIPLNTPTIGTSPVSFNTVTTINVVCNQVNNIRNYHNKNNANILFSGGLPLVAPFDAINLVTYQSLPVQLGRNYNIANLSLKLLDQNLKPIVLKSNITSFWVEIIDEGRIPTASHSVSSV